MNHEIGVVEAGIQHVGFGDQAQRIAEAIMQRFGVARPGKAAQRRFEGRRMRSLPGATMGARLRQGDRFPPSRTSSADCARQRAARAPVQRKPAEPVSRKDDLAAAQVRQTASSIALCPVGGHGDEDQLDVLHGGGHVGADEGQRHQFFGFNPPRPRSPSMATPPCSRTARHGFGTAIVEMDVVAARERAAAAAIPPGRRP